MARAADHIALANKNHGTIAALLAAGPAHAEWVATIAFYKAIHVIESVFVCAKIGNSADHEDRTFKLKHDRRFDNIYTHYRPLKEASTIARYLQDSQGRFRQFSDYLTPDKVHSELIRHRLHQIEASAARFVDSSVMQQLVSAQTLPAFASAGSAGESKDSAQG